MKETSWQTCDDDQERIDKKCPFTHIDDQTDTEKYSLMTDLIQRIKAPDSQSHFLCINVFRKHIELICHPWSCQDILPPLLNNTQRNQQKSFSSKAAS